MSTLKKPTNDWARTLFILYSNYMGGVSMAKVLNMLPHFYKFQTRLLEIERENPKLKVSRVKIPFKNVKLNKSGWFTQYTLLSPPRYVIDLYNRINEQGLKENKDAKRI